MPAPSSKSKSSTVNSANNNDSMAEISANENFADVDSSSSFHLIDSHQESRFGLTGHGSLKSKILKKNLLKKNLNTNLLTKANLKSRANLPVTKNVNDSKLKNLKLNQNNSSTMKKKTVPTTTLTTKSLNQDQLQQEEQTPIIERRKHADALRRQRREEKRLRSKLAAMKRLQVGINGGPMQLGVPPPDLSPSSAADDEKTDLEVIIQSTGGPDINGTVSGGPGPGPGQSTSSSSTNNCNPNIGPPLKKKILKKSNTTTTVTGSSLTQLPSTNFSSYNPTTNIAHRGSCYKLKTMTSDEWQTTLDGWKPLEPILKPVLTGNGTSSSGTSSSSGTAKRIWMPFYYDGVCYKHLTNKPPHGLGFLPENVHHKPNEDFFQMIENKTFLKTVDVIWDNPPYTSPDTKQKVLEGLKKTNKPFCMLLPIGILHSAFCRELLDMKKVQCIFPRKVMVKKRGKDAVPFKLLVWLCYKMELERDMYFVE